jgi:hypothetical protein
LPIKTLNIMMLSQLSLISSLWTTILDPVSG